MSAAAPNLDQDVRALLDREAIRELPALYCHHVWRNDVEGLVGLFSADGVFDEPRMGRIVGHARLREVYGKALQGLAPKPFIHNVVVRLEGADRASGSCYLDLRVPGHPEAGAIFGYYDDRYVRENGEWRFAERKVTLLTDLSAGLAQEFARAGAK